jgi:beta-1,4-mannosyl-glycoprotein beta-1,4-N-acetylglucosaminyltransferase
MIIDAFPYNDEKLVLETRLTELYGIVDFFILVEANRTQTRLEKPYHYLENKDKFAKWNDKIISIQMDELIPGGEADWKMENAQRQQILTGLDKLQEEKKIKLTLEDYLVVSDVDEIPMANKLKEIVDSRPEEPVSMNFYFNSYFANLYCPHRGWYGSVISQLSHVHNGFSPQYLRSIKDKVPHFGVWDSEFLGWHLSAMGGFETTWNKAKNNIEPHDKFFLNDKFKEDYRELFNNHVIRDGYFLFLDNPRNQIIKLEKLDISLLPKYIRDNQEKFKDFLLHENEDKNDTPTQ